MDSFDTTRSFERVDLDPIPPIPKRGTPGEASARFGSGGNRTTNRSRRLP
ncbi:hypothetical protein Rrhod_0002 [Rhodococcus rhodnii LMG 5362]|uniref:Uncharacterized protein n=1 Tax=Rhodococcus rhodnii LMG 5362 TaxID=1273125 RepID=R7WTN0_9NOCA|nr:hypothetical protein Rrhod_0002 [Rhodococcus rhodnii LMG 5362]